MLWCCLLFDLGQRGVEKILTYDKRLRSMHYKEFLFETMQTRQLYFVNIFAQNHEFSKGKTKKRGKGKSILRGKNRGKKGKKCKKNSLPQEWLRGGGLLKFKFRCVSTFLLCGRFSGF